jgi:hypothetical protein
VRTAAGVRYPVAVFLGAFLLFQVQPMLGKAILPGFGGGSVVWTTCLLFFQLLLLGGYLYAHLLTGRLSPKLQAGVHLGLALLSLTFLPIGVSTSWRSLGAQDPTWHILASLGASVGLPYLLVASASPLLQRWFTLGRRAASPYRLYAVSNLGSLTGLLTYPFLLEPLVGLRVQSVLWSAGYVLFLGVTGGCAWGILRDARSDPATITGPAGPTPTADAPPAATRILWLALSACGSVLLLATTSRITQDVAPIPFLWVLPLSLYLISFVVCFDSDRWYDRRVWTPALYLLSLASGFLLLRGPYVDLVVQVTVYAMTMFAGCMVCHGELARLKPDPRRLTSFYLTVAGGGAAGGLLVTLIAPSVFRDYWEFHVGILGSLVLLTWSVFRAQRVRPRRQWAAAMIGVALVGIVFGSHLVRTRVNLIASERGFYGVLKVYEFDEQTPRWRRQLSHGGLEHGAQLLTATRRTQPTSYYGPQSGMAVAIEAMRQARSRADIADLRIGAVGLGVGTVSAFLRRGDAIRYYEIDPVVVRLSESHFSFRSDSEAREELVLGDARVSLERELADEKPQTFDVLVLDAFASDAVPVHLLTREAFDVYWRHLAPDGILAVHVSAIHLDLEPVVRGLARLAGKQTVRIINSADGDAAVAWSDWVLVTANQSFLNSEDVARAANRWSSPPRAAVVWTDDHSNLLPLLRRARE